MFTTSRATAVLILLAVAGSAAGEPVLWSPAEGGNGHCYGVGRLSGSDLSWAAARDAATATSYEGLIGHLATVTSIEENQFITNLLLPYNVGVRYAWLGAYQADPYGPPGEGWVWITGEPWSYTNWAAGEPNDHAGARESWLAMWGTTGNDAPGTWNDEGYYLTEGWYVIEYDTQLPPCPFTLYVDASAEGAKSGRSWTDAYTDLQIALDEAARLNCGPVQVWVADGVYRPSKQVLPEDRRSATFQMSNDLSLYGGFAGGETSLAQRKPFENLTILSGDLDADDPPPVLHTYGPTISPKGPNTYWVVGGENLNSSAMLDGFVVRDGDDECSGGSDCGYTGGSGGGIFIKTGSPRIANCTITNNLGAGVSLRPGASPTLVNCRFLGNQWAGVEGYGSYPVLVNCVFTGHQAAIFVDYSRPRLVNCTITGNEQAIMFDGSATLAAYNSIIWGNLTEPYSNEANFIAYSCVPPDFLTEPGNGNISTEPEFINPMGDDGVYGTLDDDVRLYPASACVDVGNNWYIEEVQDAADLDSDGVVAEELPLDLAFKPRRADTLLKLDGGAGMPPIVDMGAYENPAEPTPWRLYVKASAEGANNGGSWANAFLDLQSALDAAERSGGTVTEIWITAAGYKPTKKTSNDPRSATFKLVSGVTIFGGFMGWETNLDQRDVPENLTYLNGDLQDNDTYQVEALARCVSRNDSPMPLGPGCEVFDYDEDQDVDRDDIARFMQTSGESDNAYHVVTAVNTQPGTALDGLAIVSGVGSEGAGIWADQSNLALRHCQLGHNLTSDTGSAMKSRGGTHTLLDCVFWSNCATYEGAALDLYGGSLAATGCTFTGNGGVSGGSGINLFRTPATLAHCEFSGNVAGYSGAGVRAYEGTLNVTDSLFTNNVAGYSGAGLDSFGTTVEISRSTFTSNKTRNGGGINASGGGENVNRNFRVINCTFRDNSAEYAGGALNLFRTGQSIINCAFVNNHADYSGGGIDEFETSPSLVNCSFIGNSAAFGSAIRNFRCSPALTNCLVWNNTPRSIADEDSGHSIVTYSDLQDLVPGTGNISQDPKLRNEAPGDVRLSDGSPCIDAGRNAVAVGPDLAGQARFVDDPFTSDTGTGTPPIVDIGAYEYYPDCNRNNVDDSQDIAGGASQDCNANGRPDECDIAAGTEPDCNGNDVPDECDIASGASQDQNGNGIPDECDPPPCAAIRSLPAGYAPGVKLTVTIEAKPAAGVAAYAVQDQPAAGWTVGAVNESGSFDAATGKVKWGPFLDNGARTLTYEATPPASAQGQQCFGPGAISLDGQTTEICGPSCVSPCFDHPADTDGDRRMVIDEVTAYASAWKRGQAWPVPPNPIPIGYVTRAGLLWKNGETYCCDFGQAPPLLWVECPPDAGPTPSQQDAGVARALRHFIPSEGGYWVTIDVQANLAAAYAVEETPPAGWALSGISEHGLLDPATGQVRWGPFFDQADRQLAYHVVPTDGQLSRAFAGQLSTDGRDQAISGSRMVVCCADLDFDSDVDGEDLARFKNCLSGPAVPLASTPCSQADFDQDGDVDQADFGMFQRCYSGANRPANPNCAN